MSDKFDTFIGLHRELLNCYAEHMTPGLYKQMMPSEQRDFCYTERVRLEEQLIKGKVSAKDFFAAARAQM